MSLVEIGVSPSLIEAARRYHRAIATQEHMSIYKAASLRRIEGGYNNAIYTFRHNDHRYCLKFYKVDERQRAQREWRGLQLLDSAGCFCAPRPFHYDAESNPPVIVMEFVGGQGLGEQSLNRVQLSALLGALREMYAITPESIGAGLWSVYGDAHTRIRLLRRHDLKARILRRPRPSALAPLALEANSLVAAWLKGSDPGILAQPASLVFCRGDPNLANCLWDGQHLRIVDFEYSGWNDRAFDLADLVEHVQSRGTPDEEWAWFVEQFALSPDERMRFQAAQQLIALFWLLKLWPPREVSESDSPERERFASQLRRARCLCRGNFPLG